MNVKKLDLDQVHRADLRTTNGPKRQPGKTS